jgi:pilus assembly protein CpaE
MSGSFDMAGHGPAAGGEAHVPPLPRISIQAFCETSEVSGVLSAVAADRRVEKTQFKVQMGGPAACVEAFRATPTPNVIIIEAVSDRDTLIGHLDQLSQYCDAGTRVLVIGHVNDIILYRELIRRGVSDYLIAPIGIMDVIRSLAEMFFSPEASPLGRSIAVVGAKGGVGASTIAHNLGWMISRQFQLQTVIADLDLPFGTAGLDFNQDPPQGIAEAVYAPDRLDANFLDRLLSRCSDHLSLLAAPATLDRVYDLNETSFDAVADLLRASTPCTVYDVPHLWTSWARRTLIGADEVVVVAAPDLGNLRNAKVMVDLLKQARPNDRPPLLVLNMVGLPKRPEIAADVFARNLEMSNAAVIPFDAQLFGTASNNGQMLSEVQAKGKTTDVLNELARLVMGRAELRQARRSVLEPLLSRLQRKKA